MSPLLDHPLRHSHPREETGHLTRFKHALTIFTNSARKHDVTHDHLHDHHHDDQHYGTQSTLHGYILNLKTKLRRIHTATLTNDGVGVFSFRALDAKKHKSSRSPTDGAPSDRYVVTNASTVANDSTDRKFIKMLIEKQSTPQSSPASSTKRRSSFGSSNSNSQNLLSVGTADFIRRRYSMASSDLTVASEDLTSREFAEHCGINVYPEDEDSDPFGNGVSILVQHGLSNNPLQSTVMSSTRSTKSKISIMEDTFWTPPSNDEEVLPRVSCESTEVYVRPEGMRDRRNSLITFADGPNLAKHKLQASPSFRNGRHSAPIPIPKPILMSQASGLQYCTPPSHGAAPLSNSSHSTDSSFSQSYSSFMNGSTVSSVSTADSLSPRTPPEGLTNSIESPIVNNDQQQPMEPSVSRTVKRGRFQVTIGDAVVIESDDAPPASTSPTDENCVVFQRRKYRPEGVLCDGDDANTPLDERPTSVSME